jgi:hypothetical protein
VYIDNVYCKIRKGGREGGDRKKPKEKRRQASERKSTIPPKVRPSSTPLNTIATSASLYYLLSHFYSYIHRETSLSAPQSLLLLALVCGNYARADEVVFFHPLSCSKRAVPTSSTLTHAHSNIPHHSITTASLTSTYIKTHKHTQEKHALFSLMSSDPRLLGHGRLPLLEPCLCGGACPLEVPQAS